MQESKIPNYIAIEGPIGVGKTSLSRKIAMDFGHELCLEESDDYNIDEINNILELEIYLKTKISLRN